MYSMLKGVVIYDGPTKIPILDQNQDVRVVSNINVNSKKLLKKSFLISLLLPKSNGRSYQF